MTMWECIASAVGALSFVAFIQGWPSFCLVRISHEHTHYHNDATSDEEDED